MARVTVKPTMPKLVNRALINLDRQVVLDKTKGLENAISKTLRDGRNEVGVLQHVAQSDIVRNCESKITT